jgi:hypothetical protein
VKYTRSLIANGTWYVSWMTGKAYYQESGTQFTVLTSIAGNAAANSARAASLFGAPIAVRERVAQSRLQSVRQSLGAAPSQ